VGVRMLNESHSNKTPHEWRNVLGRMTFRLVRYPYGERDAT
jgi:hypothetical protein